MSKKSSFFISRIIKEGNLDADKVLDALKESVSINSKKYAWTVIDVSDGVVDYKNNKYKYLFGRLVKYDPNALVQVVDEIGRKTRLQLEPNMQRSSCVFVYLPTESIFGHQRVWNEIRAKDFQTVMSELICSYYNKFFVNCEIRTVADMNRFLFKLAKIQTVIELKASVSPPNPLFGRYWKELKEYLNDRSLRNMTMKETAKRGTSLPTTTPDIARNIQNDNAYNIKPAKIGDAAILMAADGYGTAEVTGKRDSQVVVVRTSENSMQIKLNTDIKPEELATAILREVLRMKKSRRWSHG